MERADVVVIGAGAVGLAIARELALRGREVLMLEAAERFGSGVSSRNSEVIHAGIYYPRGSLKARLCVTGRELLYAFCREHGVGHRRCGKLVVASSEGQPPSSRGSAPRHSPTESSSCRSGARTHSLSSPGWAALRHCIRP